MSTQRILFFGLVGLVLLLSTIFIISYQKQKAQPKMTDYGIKISQEGYDVNTADPSQLIYSSKWSNFKIYEILTCVVTLTGSNTEGSNTVANTLPYSPVYFSYVNSSTIPNKWRIALMGGTVSMPDDNDWGGVVVNYRPATDDFSCYISHIGSGTRTFTFKIILFVDKFSGVSSLLTSDGDYGLKVSKDGFPTSANDTDLSTTSKFSNLTIIISDTKDASYPTDSVTHGLGYVPIFLVWFDMPEKVGFQDAGWYPVPTSGSFGPGSQHIEAWVDDDKIYFSHDDNTDTHIFKYILFNQIIE